MDKKQTRDPLLVALRAFSLLLVISSVVLAVGVGLSVAVALGADIAGIADFFNPTGRPW